MISLDSSKLGTKGTEGKCCVLNTAWVSNSEALISIFTNAVPAPLLSTSEPGAEILLCAKVWDHV